MAAIEDVPEVIPGQLTIDEVLSVADLNEPVIVTRTTPAGLEISYSPSPKRFYRVNGVEVPSVTSVLGCLEKPGLSWWGMKVGVEGLLSLGQEKRLSWDSLGCAEPEEIVRLLTEYKLTVNHTLSKAGDRGTSVHDAFEDWAVNGTIPHPEIYPETERPYVEGLVKFLRDFAPLWPSSGMEAEVMVGSFEHQYAGRYDLRCNWAGGDMVTKVYPKRANKVDELPGGRYLLDLKTSSGVYQSHALQLAAYEGASVECGYEPTDYRAVIHVTKTGEYELVVTSATLEDFLAVRKTYEVMQKKMLG